MSERRLSEIVDADADQLVPDDLRAIVVAALDLAFYRRQPPGIANDLASSVAFELQDRVSKLPEVEAL